MYLRWIAEDIPPDDAISNVWTASLKALSSARRRRQWRGQGSASLSNSRRYDLVEVFCIEGLCRNNVGNWPVRRIPAPNGRKNFTYYEAKDIVMADEASIGFMIWDGQSLGTLMNVYRLVNQGKKVVIYFQSKHDFINNITDWKKLFTNSENDVRIRIATRIMKAKETKKNKQYLWRWQMIDNPNPESWQELQIKVCRIFQDIGFNAESNKTVTTPRGEIELDVFASDESNVDKIKYIVECKNWNKSIPQTVIHSFTTVMNETGGNVGYIISRKGMQKGALAFTKNTNITGLSYLDFQKKFSEYGLNAILLPLSETLLTL